MGIGAGLPIGAALGYTHAQPTDDRQARLRKALIGGVAGAAFGGLTGALASREGSVSIEEALSHVNAAGEQGYHKGLDVGHRAGVDAGSKATLERIGELPVLKQFVQSSFSPSEQREFAHDIQSALSPLMHLMSGGRFK